MEKGSCTLPWPWPPNSSAQAILRAQIMLAVAAAHISFQNHGSLRGPALPPPPGMLAPLPGVGILLISSSALRGSHTSIHHRQVRGLGAGPLPGSWVEQEGLKSLG